MLGGHSEINMLYESSTRDVINLIGKKYKGNKVLAWRQIRMHSRASRLGHIINRLVNLDFNTGKFKQQKRKPFPTSQFSLQDYIDRGATFVSIERDQEEVVQSIVNRTPLSRAQAIVEYEKASEQIRQLATRTDVCNVSYSDLVSDPKEALNRICKFLDLQFEDRMLEGARYNHLYPESIKEKTPIEGE